MAHILKEEKYPNGSLKYRETELHGQPGQQVILEESWYISRVDPWQATDAAQQRSGQLKCKENFVNGQKHGIQEWWYPSQADPSDPWQATDAAQQQYRYNYVNGQQHGIQEGWYEDGQLESRKYYLDGIEVSQQVYKSYVEGLAPEVQATIDFEEPNLSKVIAMYLLP